ncbi:MAG: S-adenosylmethionine:tRNA ribosyltransferase-isomerase, partial [Phycisphaeraceae bacterium]
RGRRQGAEAAAREADAVRYNTVYAHEPGSVAAPTAGLHLTPELLAAIEARGVRLARLTLHVGLGTFAPVRSASLSAHVMHAERVRVPAATLDLLRATRDAGRRIVPVGTTSVRALESLPPDWRGLAGDWAGATELFVYPGSGFTFRFTDMLLTKFHLPRSTLLALVAALPGVGLERLKGWYADAVARGYRFYSYGDAMLIVQGG